NNDPSGQASTIDANIGQYYHDFIFPYSGRYGAGSPTGANRLFPTLAAYNLDVGAPDYSNTATATTPPPPPPSDLTAVAVKGSQVNFTWTDTSTDEDGFKLSRSDAAGWAWFATAAANPTAYGGTNASPGATYTFRITAYNADGESAPSNTATVTTPAPAPP